MRLVGEVIGRSDDCPFRRKGLTLGEKLALCSYAVLPALAHAAGRDLPSLCLFHAVTGISCPGCGMGHALMAAWRGNWQGSIAYHPLGLPFLAVWTAWVAWGLLNVRRGREFSSGVPHLGAAPGIAALALVIGVYAARLSGLVG